MEGEEFVLPEQLSDLTVDPKELLARVPWSNPFVIGLCCFHLIFFIVSFCVRHRRTMRSIMTILALVLAGGSIYISKYVETHLSMFGLPDNFFDETGVIVVVLFAVPPLMSSILIISTIYGEIFSKCLALRSAPKQHAD